MIRLLSDLTCANMYRFFPNNKAKCAFAKFIGVLATGYKIMSSRMRRKVDDIDIIDVFKYENGFQCLFCKNHGPNNLSLFESIETLRTHLVVIHLKEHFRQDIKRYVRYTQNGRLCPWCGENSIDNLLIHIGKVSD